jgi:hypothetical protein
LQPNWKYNKSFHHILLVIWKCNRCSHHILLAICSYNRNSTKKQIDDYRWYDGLGISYHLNDLVQKLIAKVYALSRQAIQTHVKGVLASERPDVRLNLISNGTACTAYQSQIVKLVLPPSKQALDSQSKSLITI